MNPYLDATRFSDRKARNQQFDATHPRPPLAGHVYFDQEIVEEDNRGYPTGRVRNVRSWTKRGATAIVAEQVDGGEIVYFDLSAANLSSSPPVLGWGVDRSGWHARLNRLVTGR